MSRPDLPTTPGEAYDMVQRLFGLGGYDDVAAADPPWWKARNVEIAKIKAMLRRRRTTPEQLGKAAWLAHRDGRPIRHVAELFALVPKAIRAWNEADAAERHERASADIADAIDRALAAGRQDLAERLLRADPLNARDLIAEVTQIGDRP